MQTDFKQTIAQMAASVLRPLIRVLIRYEYTHAELNELVRQTYVDVAYESFSLPNQKMTFSRAAVLTGLSRKEVVRYHGNLSKNTLPEKQAPNRAMRVVHGWLSDKDFLDADRKAKVLALKGGADSFESLVSQYSGDITYGAVLDELNRSGMTEQPTPDTVRLVRSAYVPQENEIEKIRILSVCVADLLGTAVHNVENASDDIRFQRQLVYSGIEDSIAKRFHELSNKQAMELFGTLTEFLSTERDKSDSDKRNAGKRVGLGIYYFEGESNTANLKVTGETHG
jgi:hypothetical protein